MSLKADPIGHVEIEVETGLMKKFPIYQGSNILGRNPEKCNIAIEEKSISDVHGKIICEDGKVKIVDLSKNGVYWKEEDNRIEKGKEIEIDPFNETVFFGTFKCVFKMILKNESDKEKSITNKGNKEENKGILEIKEESNDGVLKEDLKKDGKMKKEKKKESKEKEKVVKNEDKKVSKKLENKASRNLSKEKVDDEQSEGEKIKKKGSKEKGEKEMEDNSKKILARQDLIKNENSNRNLGEKSESKEKKQRKSTKQEKTKEEDEKNKKKEKKNEKSDDEEETKVKEKTKRRAKSNNKGSDNLFNLNHRKKGTELMSDNFNVHPRRTFIFKKALLSGFNLSFIPTVKIKIVENWRDDYDLLVMDRYSRTFKLLYSICLGIPVVSIKWIIHAEYNRSISSHENFPLEGQYKQTIINSVKSSKEGKKVFEKLNFFLIETEKSFHMPLEQIECLIEAGGGNVIKKNIKKELIKDTIFITKLEPDHEDIESLRKIEQAHRIYTVELILKSCLHQNIEWEENRFSF